MRAFFHMFLCSVFDTKKPRSDRVPRSCGGFESAYDKNKNRRILRPCDFWSRRQGIPLVGEMSRSDKGVRRKRSERVPRSCGRLESACDKIKTAGSYDLAVFGRGDRTRTCGILVPNQARYQTSPRLEITRAVLSARCIITKVFIVVNNRIRGYNGSNFLILNRSLSA